MRYGGIVKFINLVMERVKVEIKTISLPKLNNLSPTMESTALKLMEETGELAQAIGKFRGLNGEQVLVSESEVVKMITEELLDVAQTAVSMMFVIEEKFNLNIDAVVKEHIEKLIKKGYIKND
jgi:NTP pyrophosphatase (non-canonical NTP hydrolase)